MLVLYPPHLCSLSIISEEIVLKHKEKTELSVLFEILLIKSCRNEFLRSYMKMSDLYGFFDTHIAIFYGIYVIWQML